MKRLLYLIVLLPFLSLGQSSDAALTTQANVIRNETSPGGNTKTRIADMFQGLIDSKVSLLSPSVTNWNTAFGWGNHASAGYLTSLSNGNGTTANGSAVDLGGTQNADIAIIPDGDYTRSFNFGDATHNFLALNLFSDSYFKGYTEHTGPAQFNSDITLTGDDSGGTQFDISFLDAGLNSSRINAQWNQLVFKHNSNRGILLNNLGFQLTLGSDATGDIYYRNSSGYFTRLAAGTNGHVLTLAAGIPSWAAPSGGGTWGSITGTLSSQTDLQTALDARWNLGSNGTFTAPLTFTGTTTNTLSFSFPSLGTTYSKVFMLNNPTAAAAGAQQISPPFLRRGNGWKTNATAASQTVDFIDYVTPVQGAAAPTGYWSMYSSINAAAPTENFRIRSDGSLYMTGGTGFAANLYLGTAGDAYIGRGTSGTNGVFIYGPSTTANIYTWSISSFSSNNYSFTSGTGGALGLPGNFTAASGAGNFYAANATGTINMTGTSSGNVFVYGNNQTITAAKGNYTGFYHNPSVTSITGQHNAINAVTGDVRIGAGNLIVGAGSITHQGQLIHNVSTSGSDVYRRSVDWTPETVSAASGNKDYNVFLSDGITNSTCTVTVTVTGVNSSGVKSYAKEMKATFRKPGTSDMVQVGSTHDIYEDSNDLTTPSSSLSVSTDFVRVSYDSGTGAPTLQWTIFLTTKYSTN